MPQVALGAKCCKQVKKLRSIVTRQSPRKTNSSFRVWQWRKFLAAIRGHPVRLQNIHVPLGSGFFLAGLWEVCHHEIGSMKKGGRNYGPSNANKMKITLRGLTLNCLPTENSCTVHPFILMRTMVSEAGLNLPSIPFSSTNLPRRSGHSSVFSGISLKN